MIDFHSHILPGIDDGSRDVSESLALLDMLRDQQVTTVVATPHFYANEQSVDTFLRRRQRAYDALLDATDGDTVPTVIMGAEVLFYSGISRLDGLDRLCISGTRLLLLEMPMTRWTSSVVQELLEIVNNLNLTVILAHIERYISLQRPDTFDILRNNGVIMQVNASYFIERFTRRSALRQIGRGEIRLLGSDCHSLHTRPPRLDAAADIIRKKYGEELLCFLHAYADDLLTSYTI